MNVDQETVATRPAEKQDSEETRRKHLKFRRPSRQGECRFCRDKVLRVDYKDVTTLQGLLRGQGRIMSRQRSGNCARHQRLVKRAVKRARFLALLGYIEGPPGRGKPFGGRAW
jgi:small subunit ribosomal protein S18